MDQFPTKWSIMADLTTFKGCYSTKTPLISFKCFKVLVMRDVLLSQKSLHLDSLFILILGVSSIMDQIDSLLLLCNKILDRSVATCDVTSTVFIFVTNHRINQAASGQIFSKLFHGREKHERWTQIFMYVC